MDQTGVPPRGGNPVPRSGPGTRGGHTVHPRPGNMGPPLNYGGSGSHKDIKLTLLNKVSTRVFRFLFIDLHSFSIWVLKYSLFPRVQSVSECHYFQLFSECDSLCFVVCQQQGDRGSRKRYLPSDKDQPASPASKRMAMSPDRGEGHTWAAPLIHSAAPSLLFLLQILLLLPLLLLSEFSQTISVSGRDKRIPGRPPQSPQMDRPRGQGSRPVPPQGDRLVQSDVFLCFRQLEVWTFWSHSWFLISPGWSFMNSSGVSELKSNCHQPQRGTHKSGTILILN